MTKLDLGKWLAEGKMFQKDLEDEMRNALKKYETLNASIKVDLTGEVFDEWRAILTPVEDKPRESKTTGAPRFKKAKALEIIGKETMTFAEIAEKSGFSVEKVKENFDKDTWLKDFTITGDKVKAK